MLRNSIKLNSITRLKQINGSSNNNYYFISKPFCSTVATPKPATVDPTPQQQEQQQQHNSSSSPCSSTSKLFTSLNGFFEKVKKKSFMVENYMNGDLKENYKIEQIKLLDPLGNLHEKKGNEIFKIVEKDLNQMTSNIITTITEGVSSRSNYSPAPTKKTHPVLSSISSYYFQLKGKRIRPTIVLLLSRALSTGGGANVGQMKLAEIVEMIHTASLVHDDVIDEASTRREVVSINHSYSNKLAILCGDYLLARASLLLSSIRNNDVTELMSTALAELVEGEFMQAKSSGAVSFDQYLHKTYLKTSSLITNSCRSTAILSGADSNVVNIATDFGKNLGLAFQIIDDLLDYTSSEEVFGKPVSVDLTLGLATAPVLYATQEFPQLEKLIKRKFSEKGDVEEARSLVLKSKGIEKTRNLAIEYCNKAIQSLLQLPQSEARDILITLSHTVVTRNK